MGLRLLSISDTHLGEDTSVLSFDEGLERLAKALRDLFGDRPRVDELVLLGDIPDRTLSSTEQITRWTRAFMRTLQSSLDARRIVYLPGNHDHSLWTEWRKAIGRGEGSSTTPAGELVIENGQPIAQPGLAELLSIFFDGELPRELVIANPIYVPRAEGLARTYVFTHGTHFRAEVDLPPVLARLFDQLHLDRIVQLQLRAGGDVRDVAARTLEDLERVVTPFVDSLWPSAGDVAIPRTDELWYLLTAVSGKFDKRRDAPDGSALFDWQQLVGTDRFKPLTPPGAMAKSLARFQTYFRARLLQSLSNHGIAPTNLSLIYGDTHEGGWGELDGGLRVFNTGCWVVHGPLHHPPCHLFAVDDTGRERFADVSFGGVTVDGQDIVSLAASDVENRKQGVPLAARALADAFAARIHAGDAAT